MKPVIISFPRAGRTWLTTLIGLNICHYNNVNIRDAVIERKKYVLAGHDGTDKSLKIHANSLSVDKSEFKGKSVILLSRDPRDILVSAHLHATKRKGNFKGTLTDYIRDPRFGIDKVVRFYQIWRDNKNVPERFMEVTYEDLYNNTQEVLKNVCEFCKIPFTEESLSRAIEDGHIDKLRDREMTGFFKEGVGRPKRPNDQDTYYHRKGGIGGYVDYMTPEDIAYCEEKMRE